MRQESQNKKILQPKVDKMARDGSAMHRLPLTPKPKTGEYRGTSLIRNRPPPEGHQRPWAYSYCRVLGGALFLMSEVPL